MKLSELKNGQTASIVKVTGHGGFRKRIIEMGFVKGQLVESLQDAPLNDPVKYRVMGYEVSLRRSEAALVEVITEEQAIDILHPNNGVDTIIEEDFKKLALKKRKEIVVALVGNPNSGKTTLYNVASGSRERVGNYGGVTVDLKEGIFKQDGYTFRIVDLPGTYSISAYSPEERYVRKFLSEESPDVIINVVDSTNLERNLYLTTQLIDMHQHTVVALNMYDEFKKSGDKLDYKELGTLLGMPFVPIIAKTGFGIIQLFRTVIRMYESTNTIDEKGVLHESLREDKVVDDYLHEAKIEHKHHVRRSTHADYIKEKSDIGKPLSRHIHIDYGHVMEPSIARLREKILEENPDLQAYYSIRYLSIKLLEKDEELSELIQREHNGAEILKIRDEEIERIESLMKIDVETAVSDHKYGFIAGALRGTFVENKEKNKETLTERLDRVLISKIWGYPIFILFMFIMFQSTFTLGEYPMEWIEDGVAWLGKVLGAKMAAGPLKDMLIEGVLGGVGGVIVFLPNILILYFFISLMEDTGYMARAAFIMDKLMQKVGLHGKSFIPLVMGFGCNVPAIMATRTIEDRNSRFITILINPLMSCSARLPVYLLLAGMFFGKYAGLVLFGIYFLGIFLAITVALIFKNTLFKKNTVPFVMELPPYRMPTGKAIWSHTWGKGMVYLKKMGTVILIGSIIIWFLGYYPRPTEAEMELAQNRTAQIENSYLGKIGKTIEPTIKPLGFDWKVGIALLSGVAAKEIVVSTLGVIYAGDAEEEVTSLSDKMEAAVWLDGTPVFTPAVALALMVFVLIYFPCVATFVAIKNETGGWKWAFFSLAYSMALAWVMAYLTFILFS